MTPEDGIKLAQAMVDFLGWMLMPFAVFVTVEWLTGLFRRD